MKYVAEPVKGCGVEMNLGKGSDYFVTLRTPAMNGWQGGSEE